MFLPSLNVGSTRPSVDPAGLKRMLPSVDRMTPPEITASGETQKNRAWDLLCAAKQSYDRVMASARLGEAERARAAAQLAVCESSDWFWWFGDYNPTTAVAGFDRLYRHNLRQLYRLLDLTPPPVLDQAISAGNGGSPHDGVSGAMRRATPSGR